MTTDETNKKCAICSTIRCPSHQVFIDRVATEANEGNTGEAMTSKPTARERFDRIKGNVDKWLAYKEQTEFLISLVEAAVEVDADTGHVCHTLDCACKDWIWKRIEQHMAEGERKV